MNGFGSLLDQEWPYGDTLIAKNLLQGYKLYTDTYPMSLQRVKKPDGCTLATAHKKFQHTLGGAEKSIKYRVWPGRNKMYFYHTTRRETQNSPAKVFTKSAGLPNKRRSLRFFKTRPNTARNLHSQELNTK